MKARLLVFFLSMTLFACEHGVEVYGKGQVISATGSRNCVNDGNLPERCKVLVVGDYTETYTAQAEAGWKFSHWNNCPTASEHLNEARNICSFSIPQKVIASMYGMRIEGVALEAYFIPAVQYVGQPVYPLQGYSDWTFSDFFQYEDRPDRWQRFTATKSGGMLSVVCEVPEGKYIDATYPVHSVFHANHLELDVYAYGGEGPYYPKFIKFTLDWNGNWGVETRDGYDTGRGVCRNLDFLYRHR